jgi:uncharacterized protein YdeI (YjbR/CyaY-like superfamily)
MNMETEISTITPKSRQEWRDWLHNNHNTTHSVWLMYFKKKSANPTISYSDAVDEALCFGWIDHKAKPIDEERYIQYFCRRKATSVWSRVNKEKVERLVPDGLMTEAGYSALNLFTR